MEPLQGIVQILREGLLLVLVLSLPAVGTAAVVGLVIGMVQAVTQLQDQSTPFAIKLVAVMLAVAATTGWMSRLLTDFFTSAMSAAFR
jgi:type III secretion protein S